MNKVFKVTLFLSVSFSFSAFSQTTADSAYVKKIELNEIFIKGNANAAGKSIPVSFQNITITEIKQNNYGQEPSYILAQTPSITMYSDAASNWGYSYIRLRGIDQTRINMTLNGVPLNEPEDQGVYFSNYPDFFQTLQYIQIQRGTGMSKNGTASYAGSLIFESSVPDDKENYSLNAGMGSFGSFRTTGSYNTGDMKGLSTNIKASAITTDGYKYHSGNTSGSVFINSMYRNKVHEFQFVGIAGNQKNKLAWLGVPMDTIKKDRRFNQCSDENDDFTQMHLQMHYQFAYKSSKFNVCTYYNYLKGNYDFDLNNFLGLTRTNEMYNYAIKSNFLGSFVNYFVSLSDFTITTGLHFNHYKREHTGTERAIGWLYTNNGKKNEFSNFLRVTYKFHNFTLYGDCQYRHAGFNYSGDVTLPKLNWDFVNYTVGLNCKISDNLSIYYSFGKTNREPTRNDIFLGNDNLIADSLGNAVFSDVKPEKALDHEAGVRFLRQRCSFGLNFYYISFKDEIVLNGKMGPTGLPLHSNSAKSYRSGVELHFHNNLSKQIGFVTNVSLSHNRIRESSMQLEPIMSPEILLNQGFTYKIKGFVAGVDARYQSKSFIDYGNIYTIPEYFTVSCNFSYSYRWLRVYAIVNNITNKEYFGYGNLDIYNNPVYFIQAPINYFAGIQCTF
jgi:iron complex outermembrane receptor protein